MKRGLVLENGKREVWGVRMQRTALSGEDFLYHFHFLAKRKFSLSLSVRAVFLGWATEVTSLPPIRGASSSSGTSTTCGTGERQVIGDMLNR